MKIVILNLPVPEIYENYQRANHQIFADYADVIFKNNGFSKHSIIKLSRDITDKLNNRGILKHILSIKPDIVGFSIYVWNAERNIAIAKDLKLNNIITIAGGPEIQDDRYSKFFDIICKGEGESFIYNLIKNDFSQILNQKTIESIEETDINKLYPEYALTADDYKYDKLFYLETERGCPYKCSFCAYAKKRKCISALSDDNFKKSVDVIYTKDVEEIYLLAPTLNRKKNNFKKYLKYFIYKRKETGKNIKIFGELRPELLDDNDMDLMMQSEFTDLEFGVQTLKKEIINNYNRGYIKYDPIKLTLKLIDKGFKPIVDFIIGLPGDTECDLYNTIELLDKNNLLVYSNFYHLQILPGTYLKNNADKLKIIYDNKPPYFIKESPTLNSDSIKSFYGYLESIKNHSYFEKIFINDARRFYYLSSNEDYNNFENTLFYQTGSLFVEDQSDLNLLYNLIEKLFKNLSEIFHIHYFVAKSVLSLNFLLKLKELFSRTKNYYDKYRESINYSGDDMFSKQLEILIPVDVGTDLFYFFQNKGFEVNFILLCNEINFEELNKIKNFCKIENAFLYVLDGMGLSDDYIIKLPLKKL